jgi:16S rRNA (adenine1518-N6/adenine1519-N6)-dimethyltransferase
VTAAAFGQRRKMLRSSLKTLLPDPEPLLERAGIAPTVRAEELTVAEFCRLRRCIWRDGRPSRVMARLDRATHNRQARR